MAEAVTVPRELADKAFKLLIDFWVVEVYDQSSGSPADWQSIGARCEFCQQLVDGHDLRQGHSADCAIGQLAHLFLPTRSAKSTKPRAGQSKFASPKDARRLPLTTQPAMR